MTYDELLQAINWDLVSSEINKVRMLDVDREDAMSLCVAALRRWGLADFRFKKINGVESEFLLQLSNSTQIKGFIDLWMTDSNGDIEIVDWKTSADLSAEWERSKLGSRQWGIYCAALEAQVGVKVPTFHYRGLQPATHKDDQKLRECSIVNIREDQISDSIRYCEQAWAMRQTFVDSQRWLARRPSACGAFSRKCPHIDTCWPGKSPLVNIEMRPFSFSGMETFLLCPERYRLDTLAKSAESVDQDDDRRLSFGTACHLGLAEVWRQLKDLQEKQ